MTAKNFLRQAYIASQAIEVDRRKLETLKTATAGVDDAGIMLRIQEKQMALNTEIDELLSVWLNIEQVITDIPNEAYRDVLTRRYLCYQKWTLISYETCYDLRYLYRIHSRALEYLERNRKEILK